MMNMLKWLRYVCDIRYNEKAVKEILNLIKNIDLPEKYTSIQIRGGDKTLELQNIKSEEFYLNILENECSDEKNFLYFQMTIPKLNICREKDQTGKFIH